MYTTTGPTAGISRRTLLAGSATTAGTLALLSVAGSGTARASSLDAPPTDGALSTTTTALTTTQLQKLTASEAAAYARFGWSVSMNADGTTALVGVPLHDNEESNSGAVYLYDLTKDSPTKTKLTASDADGAYNRFGDAVSIDAAGTTALIGAPEAGDSTTGAAYVYDLTTNPPTETKLTATGTRGLGWSVSLSADATTALAATQSEDDIGTAYVYDLTQNPPTKTKLTASDATIGDRFGWSVSLNADGTTALIGAMNLGNGGTAYLYDLTTNPPTETKLTATDSASSDRFGYSVSINADGTTALIGAIIHDEAGSNTGAAYLYDLTTNPPTEIRFTASDVAGYHYFGYAVALDSQGTTAIIGAPGDRHAGEWTGSAYMYDLTTNPPTETKLTADDASTGATFGHSVSLDETGTTSLMGAPYINEFGDSSGAAYLYLGTGPVTSDVRISPTPVTAGGRFDITAIVEEQTGTATIASADYEIRDTSASVVVSGSMNAVDGALDEAAEAVTATTDGLPAGTYEVCVTGTNSRDIVGPETCMTFDVREPTRGFVTGGGWLESPRGAYLSNPSATGKAIFNVTAKTTPRSSTPRGHVMYRVKACKLAFKSRTLSGLTVTGSQAHLSGTGTLNRTSGYRFTLTVTDGDLTSPHAADHVHMRIWNPQDDLIYDNDANTELGRGNISLKTR